MQNVTMSPLFKVDAYKICHHMMYPQNLVVLESNLTARSDKRFHGTSRWDHKVVVAGPIAFAKKYLIEDFDRNFFGRSEDDAIAEYQVIMDGIFGEGAVTTQHLRNLHQLGRLPIKLEGLPEGSRVNIGVPLVRIKNTVRGYGWLTNYLETLMSNVLWPMITNATIAYEFRRVLDAYAKETVGQVDPFVVGYQAHDFSLRGLLGGRDGLTNIGHLFCFIGSDNIPSIVAANNVYQAKGYIAGSVPATEHSVASSNILNISYQLETFGKFEKWDRNESIEVREQAEQIFIEKMITEVFPTGIFSYVSDTFDYWSVLTNILPRLKEVILDRAETDSPVPTRFVIRPDSGNVVEMIAGAYIQTVDSLEEAEKILQNQAGGDANELSAYERGPDEYSDLFQIDGKVYKVTVYPEWSRYYKNFYYIDGWGDTTSAEVELTPEQKGSIEVLWDLFGGSITDKGFKQLHSKIGLIYGDSITMQNLEEICDRLKTKGFASTNVIFGAGSYTYQFNSRDTLGMAVKATFGVFEGPDGRDYELDLFKDPKTGDREKKSAKGRVAVYQKADGNYKLIEGATTEEQLLDSMIVYYDSENPVTEYDDLDTIRDRINKSLA